VFDQVSQQRAIVARRISNGPAADQAVPTVHVEVIFVPEGGDREIDVRCTLLARLGLGVFDRPACVTVLLAQLSPASVPTPPGCSLP
jgi:hypothetical protein